MKLLSSIVYLAVVLPTPFTVYGRIIRVPMEQPTIQMGLDSAAYGDTVLVATGSYHENITWPQTQRLLLASERGADSVTVDGQGLARVLTITGNLTPETCISGLTITNGSDSLGGGVYCFQSSPTIEYCRIVSNRALNGFGGGIYAEQASPVIRYNTIANNAAGRIGGGVFTKSASLPLINQNHLYGNRPYYGVYNADASVTVDASYNLWGTSWIQELGPFDPSAGPPDVNALWPNEMVSDYVAYRPWLTEPGIAEAEHRPLLDAVGGISLAVSPNPFRDVGSIHYTLPGSYCVTLKTYDTSGRQIASLFEGAKPAGNHTITWSPTDLPAGIYFCRLEVYRRMTGEELIYSSTQKTVLIR